MLVRALSCALAASALLAACGGESGSSEGEGDARLDGPRLGACEQGFLRGFRCGSLEVRYERADPGLGSIGIGFAVRPPTDRSQPPLGTIFAVEGGPGYSSTGSARYFVAMFGDLLERRRLVLVDTRGTGLSNALRCPGSQAGRARDQVIVARCARKLGPRFDSYRTGAAADDLDEVRRALGIDRISLYGDSYGTYLAQAYAFRHGEALEAAVLDSAYPVLGESPWYPSGPRAGIRFLKLACKRSPDCSGDTRGRLERAVRRLRSSGRSVVPLIDAIWNAGYDPPGAFLKVDEAIRALLAGDPFPYERLTAAGGSGWGPVGIYSHAMEMVVSCNDYPMLWKKQATPVQRRRQLARSIRNYPKQRFAPFTPAEISRSIFLGYRYCLTAPPPGPLYEPPASEGDEPTEAPVLILAGEMDDTVTPVEARYVADALPDARIYLVPNGGHASAIYYPQRAAARELRVFLKANTG